MDWHQIGNHIVGVVLWGFILLAGRATWRDYRRDH